MTVLAEKDSFISGDDIWIVTPNESNIFYRINWLMNFQLSKALKHKSPQLPEVIQTILKECELSSFEFTEPKNNTELPILVSAIDFLPTKWIVLLEKNSDLQDWSFKISAILNSLNLNAGRLFLPSEINASEFYQAWSSCTKEKTLSFVVMQ